MSGEREDLKTFRLNPEIWRIAQNLADKHGLSLNAYIQSVLIEDFLMSGDPEAVSFAVKFLTSHVKEKVRRKVMDFLSLEDTDALSGSSE